MNNTGQKLKTEKKTIYFEVGIKIWCFLFLSRFLPVLQFGCFFLLFAKYFDNLRTKI